MNYTEEQIQQWKAKAEKWDALDEKISEFYPEGETEDDMEGDLCTIGELAASAFGWL